MVRPLLRHWSGSMPAGWLTLDISGCAHLFGGEGSVESRSRRRLEAHGLQRASREPIRSDAPGAWRAYYPSTTRGVVRRSDRAGTSRMDEMRETLSPLPPAPCAWLPMYRALATGRALKTIADVTRPPARRHSPRAFFNGYQAQSRSGARHADEHDHAALRARVILRQRFSTIRRDRARCARAPSPRDGARLAERAGASSAAKGRGWLQVALFRNRW